MDNNPLSYILDAFDRVEKSNKQSVSQQQETNGSLKRVDENLGKYNRQLEATAVRMEAAGAKIPQSVTIINRKEYGINLSTKVWLSVVVLCVLATYFVTPEIAQHRLEQQEIKINNQQFEINYFRERNDKTATAFDKKYPK